MTLIWNYKTVQQKILDLWAANAALATPSIIKKYYYAKAPTLQDYPLIVLDFLGGPVEPATVKTKEIHSFDFQGFVATRDLDESQAEKDVEDYAEHMQSVIRGNRTLDSNVREATVVSVLKGRLWLENPEDSLRALRLIIRCEAIA